jgi:hypothetical protein
MWETRQGVPEWTEMGDNTGRSRMDGKGRQYRVQNVIRFSRMNGNDIYKTGYSRMDG